MLVQREVLTLYRGLKEPYSSSKVGEGLQETDFTECPYTALLYANHRRGVLLVLDIPAMRPAGKVGEAYWMNPHAGRYVVMGKFDDYIRGIYSAKELRKLVRAKGIIELSGESQSQILREAILERSSEIREKGAASMRKDVDTPSWRQLQQEKRASDAWAYRDSLEDLLDELRTNSAARNSNSRSSAQPPPVRRCGWPTGASRLA